MTRRVLPAETFDFLAMSAECEGGIGAGRAWLDDRPYCALGHARTQVSRLLRAGIDTTVNDRAVIAINERRGSLDLAARVSFADWCAEIGVERAP